MGKGKKIKAQSSHKVILKIKLKPLHLINNIVAVTEVTVVVVVFVVVVVVVFVLRTGIFHALFTFYFIALTLVVTV